VQNTSSTGLAAFSQCRAPPRFVRRNYYRLVIMRFFRNANVKQLFSFPEATGGPPMVENLIPLTILIAVIFGVLWFVIEAASLHGDRRS
jgi:hypothetical protein